MRPAPPRALHRERSARSGRHLPERRAEISICLMGRDGLGSAVCGLLRGKVCGGFSPRWGRERERGLCLSSPGDTTLNKAVHAGIPRKTRARTSEGLWCR